MLPAFLAMGLFAASSVAARKSVQHLGSNNASLVRILVATLLLGLYAHGWGAGFSGPSLLWFLASGLIGFGICDTAIFLALPRLGAQLTSLMVQCLSVPIGLVTEWLWLGTRLSLPQLAAITVILAGVALALAPSRKTAPGATNAPPHPGAGALALGVIAAAGQACGAVLSRHGTQLAAAAGKPIDGLSVAYQRIWAGVAFILLWWIIQRRAGRAGHHENPAPARTAAPWVLANALAGPSLGVACYQWALASSPTGIVLAISALTPLAVIPLAWWINGERPSRASIAGGLLGVAGVIALAATRAG